jgi:ATP-dependent Zn protease
MEKFRQRLRGNNKCCYLLVAVEKRAQETATEILTEHLDVLHQVAQFLQDKEVISGDQLTQIVKVMSE